MLNKWQPQSKRGIPVREEKAMTIFDTRLENTRRLVGTERGYITKFAQRMGMSKQQASHVIGGVAGNHAKGGKNIGEDMARRIEQVFGLPIGQLDLKPSSRPIPARSIEALLLAEVADMPALADSSFISRMTLAKEWVRINMGVAPEHVAIAPVSGDEMAPTLFDGDICLVDRGATNPDASGVYVIRHAQEERLFIRRIQLEPAGYLISTDNKAYEPTRVKSLIKSDTMVLGRVLMSLRPNKI